MHKADSLLALRRAECPISGLTGGASVLASRKEARLAAKVRDAIPTPGGLELVIKNFRLPSR